MVRTVKNHHEEEEDDDEFLLRTTDTDVSSQKDGKRSDNKTSSHRSKHSETEQRRRLKINERFQVLRDLIPENDQKRDKASFLLEVIQYIQFLQEKIQMYERTYQGWSPELAKLMTWRGNCVVDSLIDQMHLVKEGSIDEDNVDLAPALLPNAQNLVESDLSGSAAYKTIDHGTAAQPDSINMPSQSNLFEAEPSQSPHGSFSDTEHLASHSQHQPWNMPFSTEGTIPSYIPNGQEMRRQSEEACISNVYSKGLLNDLTHALGASGVDLSQTIISVQLDVRKGPTGGTSTIFGAKDIQCLAADNQALAQCGFQSTDNDSIQPRKRPRTEQD